MSTHPPILAVCGYSGSGKTTLIEALLPRLQARGLQVMVLKADAHKLSVDKKGKDSDRFYEAGAQMVIAHDAEQVFIRFRKQDAQFPEELLVHPPIPCDLILAEGHKSLPWPKVWLLGEGEEQPPAGLRQLVDTLPRDANRVEHLEKLIVQRLGL